VSQHLSLKFQNNTAGEGLSLRTIGMKLDKLPNRNVERCNWTANHISLKFQNNTTTFQLQTLGMNIVELTER